MFVEERPRPFVGGFITAEMLWRIRHWIDMRLRTVGCRQDDVVTGIDEGHGRHDRLVEILAGGSGPATLHFDPGRVRADDEHCSLRHDSSFAVVSNDHDCARTSACCAVRRPADDPTLALSRRGSWPEGINLKQPNSNASRRDSFFDGSITLTFIS